MNDIAPVSPLTTIDFKGMALGMIHKTIDKLPAIPYWVLPVFLGAVFLVFMMLIIFLYANFYKGGGIRK